MSPFAIAGDVLWILALSIMAGATRSAWQRMSADTLVPMNFKASGEPGIRLKRMPGLLILPGVIGTALFGFSLSYDEYARTLFTAGSDGTLPLAVMAQLDRQLTPELYAIGTVTTVMSLVAIFLCTFAFWLRSRALRGRPTH